MCGRFTRKGSPKRLLSSLGGEIGEENWINEIFLAASRPKQSRHLSCVHAAEISLTSSPAS